MKISPKGFGVVGILAVIVILGVVAFGGIYFVNHRSHNTTANTTASKQTATPTPNTSQGLSEAQIAAAPAEKIKFSGLPTELQQVIKAKVSEVAPPCIQDGQLVDYNKQPIDPEVTYAPAGSVIYGLGCDGGSASLFAKDKSNHWIYVTRTQSTFDCDAIFTYPVPKKLLELGSPRAECYDKSSNKVVTYDAALNLRYY